MSDDDALLAGPAAEPRLLTCRDDLWVFDKPAGMPVHPGEGAGLDLIRWARENLELPAGAAPIHRLDKETSGLVLVSPDREVRRRYGEAFQDGEVHKEYRALVFGRTRRKGIIRRPLPDGRRGRPLEAVTRYRMLQWFPTATYLRVRPETGRRHQIRRHLQGIGHPVVGDRRYHGRRDRPLPVALPGERLWLHAYRLKLPGGLDLRASLPAELHDHLEALFAAAAETFGDPEGDPVAS